MKKIIIILLWLLVINFKNFSQLYKDPANCDYTWATKLATIDIDKKKLPPPQYLIESLNACHKEEVGNYSHFLYYDNDINVTEEIKHKIISILNNEWTFEELRYAWNKFIKDKKELSQENLKKIFEKTKRSFKNINYTERNLFIHDSITQPYKIKFEESIRNFKIPWYIVYTAAWLNIKEVIPVLRNAQNIQSPNFNQASLTLALAKFNDSKSLDEIHNLVKGFNDKNLFCKANQPDVFHSILFLGTQESLSYTIDLIDTTKKCIMSFDADSPQKEIYGSSFIVKRLSTLIKNTDFSKIFKDEFSANPFGFREEFVTAKLLLKVKEWLINKKGKYDFYRENFFNTNSLNN